VGEGLKAMLPRSAKVAVKGVSGLRISQMGMLAMDMMEDCMDQLGAGTQVTDVVVHAGTNDGGQLGNLNVGKTQAALERVGRAIRDGYGEEIKLWWSEVLPRPQCSEENQRRMNQATTEIGWGLQAKGWGIVRHPAFTCKGKPRTEYFHTDGLHLNWGSGVEYLVREIAEQVTGE
jgi:hypothetical protein